MTVYKICGYCGKAFEATKKHPFQKYCSRKCGCSAQNKMYKSCKLQSQKTPETPRKSLTDWAREAAECNLDYGTYRALIESGKTYEQLKADAPNRTPQIHAHKHLWVTT